MRSLTHRAHEPDDQLAGVRPLAARTEPPRRSSRDHPAAGSLTIGKANRAGCITQPRGLMGSGRLPDVGVFGLVARTSSGPGAGDDSRFPFAATSLRPAPFIPAICEDSE